MHDNIWFWVIIMSIPIVAIVMGSLERISRNRALGRLAESGKSLPPELLQGIERRHSKTGTRRGGIIVMFVGIGIAIFFWAMTGGGGYMHGPIGDNGNWLPVIGVIPFMVGVGMILASFVGKDQD